MHEANIRYHGSVYQGECDCRLDFYHYHYHYDYHYD